VRVVDCMPIRGKEPDIIRTVEGLSGEVPMHMELIIRFDYGSIVPWVRNVEGRLLAVGGPDALCLTPCKREDTISARWPILRSRKASVYRFS
jgi:hypothetical protein